MNARHNSIQRMGASRSTQLQLVCRRRLAPTADAWRVMRRHIMNFLGAVLVLAISYESAFRWVTASCGNVEWSTWPPIVYYLNDTDSFPWRLMCFGFRLRLPLGKVRLSKRSEFYVDGSRFYRRRTDGSFDDITDWMAAIGKREP